MEIRRLELPEIPYASELAQVVYRSCIEPNFTDVQMHRMFYEYVNRDALGLRCQNGQMELWGAFEQGQMCGVGAFQPEGHLTMLYVLPQYQRRGIGKALLSAMEDMLLKKKLKQITVNAIPPWTNGYFVKNGFQVMPNQPAGMAFCSLEKRNDGTVRYKTRKLSERQILTVSMGSLAFLALITVIYAITTL